MPYSEKVLEHHENPRNVGTLDKAAPDVGTGLVGAPACGDVMRLQLRIGDDGVIRDAKFKTFGCGSAIASSSLVTEWVKGLSVTDAAKITNAQIAEELALPPVKIHCSVLAADAVKAAIEDWKRKRAERDAAAPNGTHAPSTGPPYDGSPPHSAPTDASTAVPQTSTHAPSKNGSNAPR